MAQTVGDFIVNRLHDWGVRKIFGYPGDGINGVFGALNRANGKIEFIQARHEEMAAFMASAYAKFTGELGVCIATSGPGASHLITGLYDARLDHMPVLRSPDNRRAPHLADTTSRNSIFRRCSRTLPALLSNRLQRRLRFDTWSTAPCARRLAKGE